MYARINWVKTRLITGQKDIISNYLKGKLNITFPNILEKIGSNDTNPQFLINYLSQVLC